MLDKRRLYIFSLELKKLINKGKLSEAKEKIKESNLSKEEIGFLFMCLNADGYDPETDRFLAYESDNSAFLNLVRVVKSTLQDDKK